MTTAEYVELWPLWTYLFGFITTFMASFAKGAYNDDDMYEIEYILPVSLCSILWPLTWLYHGGKGIGLFLKSHKEKSIAKVKERKRIEEKQSKYLKEAGFDI